MKLLLRTLIAFLLGLAITGAMLFLPAGTWCYPGAWLFMALLFIPILIMGVVLLIKNPELLRKRMEMKEREKEQRSVVALSGLLLVGSFIVAGLDFRFGWSHVSSVVVIIASIALLVSYALYAEVLRENVYLSRVVEVQQGSASLIQDCMVLCATPCIRQSVCSISPFRSCSARGGHCW